MAKVLNTTVHLSDDNGEEHVFKPGDTLPGWAESKLAESWPADREDLWTAGKSAPKADDGGKAEGGKAETGKAETGK